VGGVAVPSRPKCQRPPDPRVGRWESAYGSLAELYTLASLLLEEGAKLAESESACPVADGALVGRHLREALACVRRAQAASRPRRPEPRSRRN
jgi:hypothetical protein